MSPLDEASLAVAREKLEHLEQYWPDGTPALYRFSRVLAGRLNNPEIEPLGLKMEMELLLTDLASGIDGSGKPITDDAAGYAPAVYVQLHMRFSDLVDRAFPPEFARGYKEIAD